MSKVDGGDLVVRSLKQEGVKYIFTLAGTQTEAIYDACIDGGIRLIDARHEQAAVHMADGWSRVTGSPGVALLSAGPGVTHGISGVANAFEAASPIIVIAGRSPMGQSEMGSFQEINQVALMRSITKWATTVYETTRIPEFISTAFRHALAGRPGPAYLDIPKDIVEKEVEEGEVSFPTGYRTTARVQGDPALVREAVNLLLDAERPLVIAGSGAWWSQAGETLEHFIEAGQLPLFLTGMARGCVREDHPLCFGSARVGTRQADVVMVIGTRFNYRLGYGRPPLFNPDAKVIQVDIDGGEIGRNRPVDIGIVGDARAVLSQMIEEVGSRRRKQLPWIEELRSQAKSKRQEFEAELTSDAVPIKRLRLCKEIGDFLDRDATIVADGGEIAIWASTILKSYLPGHWLDHMPMFCLGVGIPFGIAAKLARPDKQVLVVTGDGSFGVNAMEFDTAVRHNIPIVTVISNDGAWGAIKHGQEATYGRVVGTELGYKRYDKIVEALGGYGEYVESLEGIRPALERAFASGLPACVNVIIDPTSSMGGA